MSYYFCFLQRNIFSLRINEEIKIGTKYFASNKLISKLGNNLLVPEIAQEQ